MSLGLRWALTLILIPIAAFCCFGFLASGELSPELDRVSLALLGCCRRLHRLPRGRLAREGREALIGTGP